MGMPVDPSNPDAATVTLSIQTTTDGVAFFIHVTPRARREAVGGAHGDALRVAVKEPPVEGKANEACAKALAKALGLRREQVRIDPEAKSRRKRVHVLGKPSPLVTRLEVLAAAGKLR